MEGRARRRRDGESRLTAASWVTLVLLVASGSGAAGSTPPAWVRTFPADADRYVGIARIDKAAHPADYREAAQTAALAQMSREISVHIEAENQATASEGAAGREEAWSQKINARTGNDLSGYELEGVYETEREFWAYYILDKENFREAEEERTRALEAGFDAEETVRRAALGARRLQALVDADARMRALALQSKAPPLRERCQILAQATAALTRGGRLDPEPAVWSFDFGAWAEGRKQTAAILISDAAGEKWRGPFVLSLKDLRRPEAAPCRVETDGNGRFDLARPVLDCGLKPGLWEASWSGPDSQAARATVKAELRRRNMAVTVAGPQAALLSQALAALDHPRYALVSGRAPALEITLSGIFVDSMDGLYFASAQGSARFPGSLETVPVTGKGGHSDRDRAISRALGDLAREVGKLLP
jgi:hypothetical protein